MKIPLKVPCWSCHEPVTVTLTLPDREISFTCTRGHDNSGPVESEVGSLVLTRAEHEFKENSDLTLAVVLSAMAFDTEISRLHHKWRTIAAYEVAHDISDEELDVLLRKHSSVRDKMDHVAGLMHAPGLDDFVGGEPDLRQIVTEGYPSLKGSPLSAGFQQALFWPRNRVVHMGHMVRERQQAVRALNLSRLGIYIFDRMDQRRRQEE